MKNILAIAIWAVVFVTVSTTMCSLLTRPDTMANTIGFFGVVGLILLSLKTKCFTSIITKSNESNEK